MGLKLLGHNDKVIYEFEDDGILLSGLITRAKFGEKFDSEVTFNNWMNDLYDAIRGNMKPIKDGLGKDLSDIPNPVKAPDYYIKSGMTDNDYGFRDFFNEITFRVSTDTALLRRWRWAECNRENRQRLIRMGLHPHTISDARLDQMIEDIDNRLEAAASLFNPEY